MSVRYVLAVTHPGPHSDQPWLARLFQVRPIPNLYALRTRKREQLQYDVGPLDNVGRAVLVVYILRSWKAVIPEQRCWTCRLGLVYVFCRLRNLHAHDIVGHVGRFLRVLAQRLIFIPRTVLDMPRALL